jgi:hypothetical protein
VQLRFVLAYWGAVLRNPVALTGLAVDLLPIWAVLAWGWGAIPLVLLYWLENVVIGVFTIPRVVMASIAKSGWIGVIGGLWAAALFSLHYGLFCFGHGGILLEVFGNTEGWATADTLVGLIGGLVEAALSFGQDMSWVLAAIVVWHAFVFTRDYILGVEWRKADAQNESFSPYGRVIVFHIGVFVVAGTLEFLGDPAIGALALVIARAAWGLRANMRTWRERPSELAPVAA